MVPTFVQMVGPPFLGVLHRTPKSRKCEGGWLLQLICAAGAVVCWLLQDAVPLLDSHTEGARACVIGKCGAEPCRSQPMALPAAKRLPTSTITW